MFLSKEEPHPGSSTGWGGYCDAVDNARICGHCRQPMRGYASAHGTWLCHPDDGMDCYRLVTVYRHEMPCDRLESDRRYFEALGEFLDFLQREVTRPE